MAAGLSYVICDRSDDPWPLPSAECFDFVLFDERVALVHDYGQDGLQVGGWQVDSPEALDRLCDTAHMLRQRSEPLDDSVQRHNIRHG
ncbi:MAG: hypothetical protein HKP61_13335 [Dactylosporangium sp.]|nr:hypothetical protein [Dactylosporangium sp.]NNJ61899.1 hypothetical protein [Dactylosporangium sp.]